MRAPRWAVGLLRRAAPPDRVDDVIGDLEEAHRSRLARRSRVAASVLTSLEALDVARAFLLARVVRRGAPISLLDFKLGARMLMRYPGLTTVAGLSMAFAIWASASAFEFFHQIVRPTLPFDDANRIVTISAWDPAANQPERRIVSELLVWQDEARTLELVGAYRASDRNLVVGEAAYPLTVAEMSASAFRLAGVVPLRGRVLLEEDARPGATSVAVIGFRAWHDRFGSDDDVIGRTVRLGTEDVTIVGVMPQGFAFPINHEAWSPLRLDRPTVDGRSGPAVEVFARLAPDATQAEARIELATLARRTSAVDAGEALRVSVVRYGSTSFGLNLSGEWVTAIVGFNLLPVLLLLLISSTVALLMFARAAAREGELTVRTALGASRRRIVGQLFVEALVLSGLATVAGLAATGAGIRWLMGMFEAEVLDGSPVPFWVTDELSGAAIGYATALAVLGALVAGAGPGLKLTKGLGVRLRAASAGGGGARFGGVWTAVIIVQVAFTVVFPSVAVAVFREGMALRDYPVAIADEEFLGVQVRMDRQPAPGEAPDTSVAAFVAAYAAAFGDLRERLSIDPSVLGVTFAERLPRTYHGWNQIEVDVGAVPVEDPRGHRVGRAGVDVDYFDIVGAPILAGRGFTMADLESGAPVVIVDQPFVDRVLGGANPIGRRIRYIAGESARTPTQDGPWYEIIGVAPDLGVRCGWGYGGIYHPTRPRTSYPLRLVIHVRGDPEAFVPRVRAVAAAVDSRIRLYEPLPLDESTRISEDAFYDFWIMLAFVVCAVALLISLAAIYSVTSFVVVRRTREIGIRVAVGGRGVGVAGAILKRPLIQVGAGIALGTLLTWGLRGLAFGDAVQTTLVVLAYGLLMATVCATACIVPTRRALAVQPTEALRADG